MSSAIGFREFNEDEYRKFVQTLSDDQLVKTGQHLRWLSGDGKIVTTTPSAFDAQLKICLCRPCFKFPPPLCRGHQNTSGSASSPLGL